MLKKIFTLTTLFLIVISLIADTAFATSKTTNTPTPTSAASKEATESAEQKTIEKIKEMVADKVSKLNLVEKRGFVGTVTDTSTTQIVTQDLEGKKRFVDIDELTKFQESIGSSKTFGISDVKKGDRLSFVGLYNKDTERLLARIVSKTDSIPTYIDGVIESINSDDFVITIVDKEGKKHHVDVERSTSTQSYSNEDGMQKSGFSKLEKGERIIAVGFLDKEEKDSLSASRILHFTDTQETNVMEATKSATPTIKN